MRTLLLLAILLPGAPLCRAQREPTSGRDAARALFLRGLTQAALGNTAEAAAQYREALEALPGEPAVLAALAEALEAQGDIAGARAYADEGARLRPDESTIGLLRARLAEASGDLSGASAMLDAHLERHPADAEAIARLAALRERGGDTAGAAALLDRRLALGEPPDALRAALRLHERLGNDARVTDLYVRLLALEPTAALWTELAAHHVRQGRTIPAREAFVRARALDPSNVEARAGLASVSDGATQGDAPASSGRASYAAGRFEEAAPRLAAETDADPRDAIGWRFAGMAALEAGDATRAARLLEDALLIFQGDAGLRVAAAYAALASGDASAAADHLREADAALTETAATGAVRDAVRVARGVTGNRPLDPEATRLWPEALAPRPGGTLARALVSR